MAADLNVPLAKYGELLDAQPPREMVGVDGVHPGAAAHNLIAEALTPVLIRACRTPALAKIAPVTGLSI